MTNSKTVTHNNRILYSQDKAINLVAKAKAIPQRVWRILYPVFQIEVEGWQRPATDFEPIELLIEKGIRDAGLNNVAKLSHFFKLEPRFVEKLIHRLSAIGHINRRFRTLTLTDLAHDSLRDGHCYHWLRSQQVLYFEALSSAPLTTAHYALQFYSQIPPNARHFVPLFFNEWDPRQLENLKLRSDRYNYNIPQEMRSDTVIQLSPEAIVYLPVYVIAGLSGTKRKFFVFSAVKGSHNAALETAFNAEQDLTKALTSRSNFSWEKEIANYLSRRKIPIAEQDFEPNSPMGPQLIVRIADIILDDSREKQGISLQDIGRYINIEYNNTSYCLWLTAKDPKIRRQALMTRILQWLQGAYIPPAEATIKDEMEWQHQCLGLDPEEIPTWAELLTIAKGKHMMRAIDRLETIVGS